MESTDVPKPSFDLHEPDTSGFHDLTTDDFLTKNTYSSKT